MKDSVSRPVRPGHLEGPMDGDMQSFRQETLSTTINLNG